MQHAAAATEAAAYSDSVCTAATRAKRAGRARDTAISTWKSKYCGGDRRQMGSLTPPRTASTNRLAELDRRRRKWRCERAHMPTNTRACALGFAIYCGMPDPGVRTASVHVRTSCPYFNPCALLASTFPRECAIRIITLFAHTHTHPSLRHPRKT